MSEHDAVIERVWGFVRGDIPEADFERWVYADADLERHLGPDLYLATISTNFRDRHATSAIRAALARHARARPMHRCVCIRLQDLAAVDMGSFDAPSPASVSYTHLTLPTTPYV